MLPNKAFQALSAMDTQWKLFSAKEQQYFRSPEPEEHSGPARAPDVFTAASGELRQPASYRSKSTQPRFFTPSPPQKKHLNHGKIDVDAMSTIFSSAGSPTPPAGKYQVVLDRKSADVISALKAQFEAADKLARERAVEIKQLRDHVAQLNRRVAVQADWKQKAQVALNEASEFMQELARISGERDAYKAELERLRGTTASHSKPDRSPPRQHHQQQPQPQHEHLPVVTTAPSAVAAAVGVSTPGKQPHRAASPATTTTPSRSVTAMAAEQLKTPPPRAAFKAPLPTAKPQPPPASASAQQKASMSAKRVPLAHQTSSASPSRNATAANVPTTTAPSPPSTAAIVAASAELASLTPIAVTTPLAAPVTLPVMDTAAPTLEQLAAADTLSDSPPSVQADVQLPVEIATVATVAPSGKSFESATAVPALPASVPVAESTVVTVSEELATASLESVAPLTALVDNVPLTETRQATNGASDAKIDAPTSAAVPATTTSADPVTPVRPHLPPRLPSRDSPRPTASDVAAGATTTTPEDRTRRLSILLQQHQAAASPNAESLDSPPPPSVSICGVCSLRVTDQTEAISDNQRDPPRKFHDKCFVCSVCKRPLAVDRYKHAGGVLYCATDFAQLFMSKCGACLKPIAGRSVKVGLLTYHRARCAVCSVCGKAVDEEGAHDADQKLVCKQHLPPQSAAADV
eukprot:TRINITY_DN811_c0_g1_i1.p1 TRINITY_DN811_c0_g1~~TRINITY_DN811_c0_g1_i1.p1  ORF type:complete len:693 (+),score=194.62 TRINITY_DN811_c0_g1_i1:99-2177(+)